MILISVIGVIGVGQTKAWPTVWPGLGIRAGSTSYFGDGSFSPLRPCDPLSYELYSSKPAPQPFQTTKPKGFLRRRRDDGKKDCDVKMKIYEGI